MKVKGVESPARKAPRPVFGGSPGGALNCEARGLPFTWERVKWEVMLWALMAELAFRMPPRVEFVKLSPLLPVDDVTVIGMDMLCGSW